MGTAKWGTSRLLSEGRLRPQRRRKRAGDPRPRPRQRGAPEHAVRGAHAAGAAGVQAGGVPPVGAGDGGASDKVFLDRSVERGESCAVSLKKSA